MNSDIIVSLLDCWKQLHLHMLYGRPSLLCNVQWRNQGEGRSRRPPPPIFAKYFKKSHKLAKIYQKYLGGKPPKPGAPPSFHRSWIRHWCQRAKSCKVSSYFILSLYGSVPYTHEFERFFCWQYIRIVVSLYQLLQILLFLRWEFHLVYQTRGSTRVVTVLLLFITIVSYSWEQTQTHIIDSGRETSNQLYRLLYRDECQNFSVTVEATQSG